MWAISLKNKNSQTITNEFSLILAKSKRSPPLKIESDRGSEWYNSIIQNFLKAKHIQHYSQFTYKGPSICERVIRSLCDLLKKPVLLKGNADWLCESVIKKYNNTFHHTVKKTPIQASKNVNEKVVYNNLKNNRGKHIADFQLGQLVRSADIKRVFSKGD